jgi:hypothetical protein
MQLYGPRAKRDSRVGFEAGRQCMACWLVRTWENKGDPRAIRTDRYVLAGKIALGKDIDITGLPDDVPVVATKKEEQNGSQND